ncbi:hypothetical protein CSUI_005225 [Cystoisospora suis]|uniref:Uncharacterized protein n=1 Tax=Cystoisospora suis TaxID=483139 RepID=A0A2C6KYQ7_9APIC|nr:hypothetical protein CSUI_005225 [Cystoisospora suis]
MIKVGNASFTPPPPRLTVRARQRALRNPLAANAERNSMHTRLAVREEYPACVLVAYFVDENHPQVTKQRLRVGSKRCDPHAPILDLLW